jgi:riboflavin synthase
MFTGIVEELGHIHAVEEQSDAVRLTVRTEHLLADVRHGDSISVNGCCLTVVATGSSTPGGPVDLWTADVMAETLARTTLAGVGSGDRVNLERALRADQRLGGHVVQGHVDAWTTVLGRQQSENWDVVTFGLPADLAPLVVEKGSITVDGVSLTVVAVTATSFSVSLIPETLARTTLGVRNVGERVNLESDVLAKHVAKLVQAYLPAGGAA